MISGALIYQAEGLQLVKGKKQILNIEELQVKESEVFSLIGPNGAGKSSLLLTLALLWQPTRGCLKINGIEVTSRNILELRRQIAMVFQDPLLMDTTVMGNVTTGLRIRGIPGKKAENIAIDWLERMGVAHLSRRSALHLSGGEAQRVNLARALALRPRILLMDEPFAAVDYPTRWSLLKEIGKILEETKITTIFVTHDYAEIPVLSQRVGVLLNGRLIKCGSIGEIFGKLVVPSQIPIPWIGFEN